MKITVTKQTEVNVTPELLAEIFWEMSDDNQAEFFNHLGEITNAPEWLRQVEAILKSPLLDRIGRRRMETFTIAGVSEDDHHK